VERICESLVAIDAGKLLRADRISSMTRRRDVLVVEVDEGVEQLLARLGELGLTVRRAGRELLVPLESDDTFDLIMGAVAALDLPLHRLDQRRHGIAELFADRPEEATHGRG
jgi:ABC-2 type transport system ATP-binding protein